MPATDRPARVRDLYRAFASADRDSVEKTLADDFRFSSPVDVGLGPSGLNFERCWYEMKQSDGSRGRNTEVLTFKGEQLLPAPRSL